MEEDVDIKEEYEEEEYKEGYKEEGYKEEGYKEDYMGNNAVDHMGRPVNNAMGAPVNNAMGGAPNYPMGRPVNNAMGAPAAPDLSPMEKVERTFAELSQRYPRGCEQIQAACRHFFPSWREGVKIPFFSCRYTNGVWRAGEVEQGDEDYHAIMELITEYGEKTFLFEIIPVAGGGNAVPRLLQRVKVTYFGNRLWQWWGSMYVWQEPETGMDARLRTIWMNTIYERFHNSASFGFIALNSGFDTVSAIIDDYLRAEPDTFLEERSPMNFNNSKSIGGGGDLNPAIEEMFRIMLLMDDQKLTYRGERTRKSRENRLYNEDQIVAHYEKEERKKREKREVDAKARDKRTKERERKMEEEKAKMREREEEKARKREEEKARKREEEKARKREQENKNLRGRSGRSRK